MNEEFLSVIRCRECGRDDRLYRYTPGFMRRNLIGPSLQPEGSPEWHPAIAAALFSCEACGLTVTDLDLLVER